MMKIYTRLIIFPVYATDASSFHGLITAYGGVSPRLNGDPNSNNKGAPGTVFLSTNGETQLLIINSLPAQPYSPISRGVSHVVVDTIVVENALLDVDNFNLTVGTITSSTPYNAMDISGQLGRSFATKTWVCD